MYRGNLSRVFGQQIEHPTDKIGLMPSLNWKRAQNTIDLVTNITKKKKELILNYNVVVMTKKNCHRQSLLLIVLSTLCTKTVK